MTKKDFVMFLETKYNYSIVDYMYRNGEIKQNALFRELNCNHEILRKKLNSLEQLQLVTQDTRRCSDSNHVATFWKLTSKGMRVGKALNLAARTFDGEIDLEDDVDGNRERWNRTGLLMMRPRSLY